jgi:hypothetical protein
MDREIGQDEWRVEVELDDPEHGYGLAERLAALDLADEVRDRLRGRVIVTRDGSELFAYASEEEAAREALSVIKGVIDSDEKLTAELTLTRWHPVEEAWKDASIPLPETDAEYEAERARKLEAEHEEVEATGSYEWQVVVELDGTREASKLKHELQARGSDVHQRFRYLVVGAASEEEAASTGVKIRELAPGDAKLEVRANPFRIRRPVFVWLEGLIEG